MIEVVRKMLPLVVIVHSPDGQTRRYAFGDSPITIGRSPVAELQLSEPFISRWEGTLRFDADKITYFSLGGTNPTYANGQLIAENQDVTIGPKTVLTIGDLQLTFLREHVDPQNVRYKGKTAPKVREQEVENKTVFLDVGAVSLRSPTTPPPPSSAPIAPWANRPHAPNAEGVRAESVRFVGDGGAYGAREPSGDPARNRHLVQEAFVAQHAAARGAVRNTPAPAVASTPGASRAPRHDSQVNATPAALASQLDRMHSDYRASWNELYGQIVAHLGSVSPERRGQAVSELERRYPLLGQEAEFQALLRSYGIARAHRSSESGANEVQAWLRGIARDVLPDTAEFDTHNSLQRIFELLETLAQSFAELNDAQESVRKRWLGRAPRSSVLRSDNANAILAYLLNPQADWSGRLQELEQTVRDSVMHELALLKATMEGARNLLAAISPHAIAEAEGIDGESFAEDVGRASLLDRWRGNGGANTEARLWRRFVSMYQSLLDSDRYQRVFMGRIFARTYLAAMGQEQHDTPSRY
ncbi:MAG TPA: FHA domain-containing protein [Polyangiales bacterium]